MKKAVSIVVASALLFSFCMISFNAAESWMDKFDQPLQSAIDSLEDDESIAVWFWFTDIDTEEMERRIEEETGLSVADVKERQLQERNKFNKIKREIEQQLKSTTLTAEERTQLQEQLKAVCQQETDEYAAWYYPYRTARFRIMREMYREQAQSILEKFNVTEDQIIFSDTMTPSAILRIDKSTLFALAQSDRVISASLYNEDELPEPAPVQADVPTEADIKEKLTAYLAEKENGVYSELYTYKELYRHIDTDGTVDWILLNATGGGQTPWMECCIMSHRCLIAGETYYHLFKFGIGLYDVQEEAFYDLARPADGVDYYAKYNGLAEAIDIYGVGRLLGDLDGDNEISVADVTILQRCEAHITGYPERDEIERYENTEDFAVPISYYSDFNRDGERDILDATCIQRYLAGMTYPIG